MFVLVTGKWQKVGGSTSTEEKMVCQMWLPFTVTTLYSALLDVVMI